MKKLFFLVFLVGCSTAPQYAEMDEIDEFLESDFECLEAEFDNDKKTKCTLKQ